MNQYESDLKLFSSFDIYFAEFLLKADRISDDCIKYALSFLFFQSKKGHLCIKLYNNDIIPSGSFSVEFIAFIREGFFKLSKYLSQNKFKVIVEYKNCFYLHKNWIVESILVNEIKRLELISSFFLDNPIIKAQSQDLFRKKIISNEQFVLFEKFLKKALIFLSGGPGTGKTYLASKLLEIVSKAMPNTKVIITAPTGKAVSNLQDKITNLNLKLNYQAKTMHSLLKFQPIQNKNFKNIKLHADLIIVDEASMVDAYLFAMFLGAIKDSTTVIFMGDQNQLSPIEGGLPFADIVSAKKKLCVSLKKCHRFENNYLTNALIENRYKEFMDEIQLNQIYTKLNMDLPSMTINSSLIPLVEKYLIVRSLKEIEPEAVLKKFEQFRILNCIRQGELGVDAINIKLYKFFCEKYSKYNYAYPILITENNSQMRLFNGMTGIIIKEKQEEHAYFMIKNKLQKLPKLSLPKFELGFVISVHKSQGSEYENVYIIMPKGSEVFGRQILYTAITRAKKSVKIAGPLSTIEATIKNFEIKNSQIFKRLN
jgi:exodeoxyribonuclease V alpha subunit